MGEILTEETRQRVIDSWVAFPWWSARRMWEHLQSQESRITLPQVKQIGRESGWTLLRQRLRERYQISTESFRPRDEWLVEQLLGQVQRLVERLEALGGLTDEQQIALADLSVAQRVAPGAGPATSGLALGTVRGTAVVWSLGVGGG